jgi:hypothetical protein
MNELLWILIAGAAGGLTGVLSREKGYGKVLSLGCTICLDIWHGIHWRCRVGRDLPAGF